MDELDICPRNMSGVVIEKTSTLIMGRTRKCEWFVIRIGLVGSKLPNFGHQYVGIDLLMKSLLPD